MKNENIHDNLDFQEIRDFLAKNISKEGREGTIMDVEYIEREIKKYQEFLKHAKIYQATKSLIKNQGWEEFDISDEIPDNKDEYFPFIGTEEEYKKLMEKIDDIQ